MVRATTGARRAVVRALFAGSVTAAGVLAGGGVGHAGTVGDSVPATTVPDAGAEVPVPTSAASVPANNTLPTLPPECDAPDPADVVFIGRVVDAADGVGRFVVRVVRSDPSGLLAVGRPVDVRIGDDLRFLVYGNDYLVSADHTADNALRSKVRQPEPIFGGDQVVDVNDFGVQCPALTDPIVIRNDDGSALDTGVLSGFFDDRRGIALAVGVPVLAVGTLLVLVWGLRRLVAASLRQPM